MNASPATSPMNTQQTSSTLAAGAPLLLSSPRRAPQFSLPANDDSTFTLAERLSDGPLLLVFYRGHWCPYCRRYLAKLQQHHPRLLERRARLAAISPEPLSTSRRLAREMSLPFPLLSDADGRVIDQYGVRNGFTACRTLLPHPAVFLIDPAGLVRFQSIDRNYKKRTTIRTMLLALDALA